MNKKLVMIASVCSLFASSAVLADNHSFSVGYAQSMVKNFEHIKGVNAQYRYEWDSPLSLLTSMTYMSGSDSFQNEDLMMKGKADVKYFSLMAGPAYRLNDYVSAYVAGGLSHSKSKYEINMFGESFDETKRTTNFAYGAGVIINPTENIVINAGYEGSRTKLSDERLAINGFNVGVGYRF